MTLKSCSLVIFCLVLVCSSSVCSASEVEEDFGDLSLAEQWSGDFDGMVAVIVNDGDAVGRRRFDSSAYRRRGAAALGPGQFHGSAAMAC